MYTLIFRRQRYRDENYGSSDAKTSFYSTPCRDEAMDIIVNCVTTQLDIEHNYKVKYRKGSHPYGDYDFVVLYNGFMIYEGVDWDDDGVEDYTNDLPSENISWDQNVVFIDVRNIIMNTKRSHAQRYEMMNTFHAVEQKIKKINEDSKFIAQKEKSERDQLAKLLEKYPDMVKYGS